MATWIGDWSAALAAAEARSAAISRCFRILAVVIFSLLRGALRDATTVRGRGFSFGELLPARA
jgi:hypothetical protein